AHAQAALDRIGTPRAGQAVSAIVMGAVIGDAHALMGEPARAVEKYEQAVAQLRKIGRGNTGIGETLEHNLAGYLSRAGQPLKASELLARQILAREATGQPVEPSSLTNYGRVLVNLGRYEEAQSYMRRGLAEHIKQENPRAQAFAQLGLALATCHQTPFAPCESALAQTTQALQAVMSPKHSIFGNLQQAAGRAALVRQQPQEAHERLAAALSTFDSAGDHNPARISTLALLAQAQLQLKEFARAKESAEAALEAARAASKGLAHTEWMGSALMAQGSVQRVQGDPNARATLQQALEHFEIAAGPEAPPIKELRAALASF
ncbi:MAG: hypothetical protein ACRCV9_00595, partial [Burkholderiaceae bacterium]